MKSHLLTKFLTSWTLLSLIVSAALYAAEDPVYLIDNPEWRATVGAEIPCSECLTGKKLVIVLETTNNGDAESIVLENPITEISDMAVHGSILSITGAMPYGGESVVIYSLEQHEIVTEFRGYNVHVSPDNRYFVYRRFFPRFANKLEATIMLFDTEEALSVDYSGYSPEDVGVAIFPVQEPPQTTRFEYKATPGFSLDHVFFDEENQSLSFVGIDNNFNLVWVHKKLWEAGERSNFETCVVPFSKTTLGSEYLSAEKKNVVEKVDTTLMNKAVIDLYEIEGVAANFVIDLKVACPSN